MDAGLYLSCPQAEEIARLIGEHEPEAVALRPGHAGSPRRLTMFLPHGDLVFMVDISGSSWPVTDMLRAA